MTAMTADPIGAITIEIGITTDCTGITSIKSTTTIMIATTGGS
jgi:hypothetical protein